jgi:hypothetical protein
MTRTIRTEVGGTLPGMRNPPWVRDELILALDLYFKVDPLKTSESNPEIVALSELLKRLPIHAERPDAARFRNPSGVYMKLCNFLRLDPSYPGEGLKAGSKGDTKVWEEFAHDRESLDSAARRIKASVGDAPPKEDERQILPDLHAIVEEINSRARDHEIGSLQDIRTGLKQLARKPGHAIFSPQTTKPEWAFHHGGRAELQFNVGFENVTDGRRFRHGIAFSFEANQTLPSPIEVLTPKMRLFNDFMELNAGIFRDLRMWHYESRTRSAEYMPGPIPWERAKVGVFVFLGRRQQVDTIDYDLVVSDMDRLLPLYRYVESGGASPPVPMRSGASFVFRAGCSLKPSSAVATLVQRQLDVALRHNELQESLHRKLVGLHGAENVATENPSGTGTRVDVVVRQGTEYWFYEIKTALSPRACIREAVGQLLEYAFWPGGQAAFRLIVVGETAIDAEGEDYLRRLRKEFSLPIEYEQIHATRPLSA